MKRTISISKGDFRDAFQRRGRGDNFSYEGLGALYDHLEEGTAQGAEEYELDVIELCCLYSEEPIKDVLESYGLADIEDLREHTTVVWSNDEVVLYAQY